jgi:hypothetical protein
MSNQFTTLTSVNRSQYDDSYYASIDPEALKSLLAAYEQGAVNLNKNGKISLKGWKNESKEGGQPYISLKWAAPLESSPAPAAPAESATFEDIPF